MAAWMHPKAAQLSKSLLDFESLKREQDIKTQKLFYLLNDCVFLFNISTKAWLPPLARVELKSPR